MNYYNEQNLSQIVTSYKSGTTVQELAQQHNIPVRSIIAKLSNLGVYVAKVYTTKTGEPVVLKEQLLEQIAEALCEPVEKIESLEKCTKTTLKLILKHLKKEQ